MAHQFSKEYTECLFCHVRDEEGVYPSMPTVVRCRRCGFVYSNPRLKAEDFLKLYSQDYFESHSSETMGYDNYVSDKKLVERTFRRRLERLERKWLKNKGRVLDVGCATGFFLTIAREMGWSVDGVEISRYCCEFASKNSDLNLHNNFFKDVQGLSGGFQLVTMWDYLEHSLNPDKDLERAYELLAPGGFIAITTPDFSSLPAKIFKNNWMGFKEHEHLYYFTKKNLSELARRAGFEVISTRLEGKYISSKFFVKRLHGYSRTFARLADRFTDLPMLREAVFYCNPLDIVYLVAQKV